MTATPIPRTLSLTVYGDLETSIIDEMPAGRSPIRSAWRPSEKLDDVYGFVEKQLEQGRQAYIVCPLIDDSEKLEAASAVAEAQRVGERFPHRRIGLLHGRMKSEEKERVMERFRLHEFDILVSTTVVEVGVDVPNASMMVIQNADRFGLAQLHQLRGRVGRGQHQSYCAFVADPASEEGVERMRVIASTSDGFKIAEEDLKFRGPGDFIGSRQSGLPDLKVADLVRDRKVLERARAAARELVARDAFLAEIECQQLKDEVLRCFRGQLVTMLS
jgi:ATP-dependent DNA helicase RecG